MTLHSSSGADARAIELQRLEQLLAESSGAGEATGNARSDLLERMARLYLELDRPDEAMPLLKEVLTLCEREDASSLATARAHEQLAEAWVQWGATGEALESLNRALEIRERHDPSAPAVANTLENLATIGQKTPDEEWALLQRALVIRQEHDPRGLPTARTLQGLGVLRFKKNDLGAARDYFERALEIREQHDPFAPGVVGTLRKLGQVWGLLGNDARSQYAQARAREIEALRPLSDEPADGPAGRGQVLQPPPNEMVPLVPRESTDSPDQLGRFRDARSIGGLLASRDLEPPLAVGLFGAWGSGKTHFMHQIEKAVEEMRDSTSPAFHRRIEQVWFNAWHYAEDNLWASLLSHIWASLDRDGARASDFLKRALAKVDGARALRAEADDRLRDAEDAARTAADARDEAEQGLSLAIHRGSRVAWWKTTIAVALYVLATVTLLGAGMAWFLADQERQESVRIVIAVSTSALALIAAASAGVAKALAFHQSRRNAAAGRQKSAHAAEVQLEIATAAAVAAAAEEARARTEASRLQGSQLLRSYLEDRAKTGDYSQYLGIVGAAHRDLQQLSMFLSDSSQDNTDPEGIDRIVLYIDDLDRCAPETVARVLEAVHLLLASPAFVVVVGVDRYWLDYSLTHTHAALLASGDRNRPTSTRDYLDKIFHLTYSLPPMTAGGAAGMISAATLRPLVTPPPRTIPKVRMSDAKVEGAKGDPEVGAAGLPSHPSPSDSSVAGGDPTLLVDDAPEVTAAAFELTPQDREALRRVAPLLSSSPRRLTRFISTFVVVRARAMSDATKGSPLLGGTGQREAIETLVILVATIFGIPDTARRLLEPELVRSDLTLAQWLASVPDGRAEDERVATFLRDAGDLEHHRMCRIVSWLPLTFPYTSFALTDMARR